VREGSGRVEAQKAKKEQTGHRPNGACPAPLAAEPVGRERPRRSGSKSGSGLAPDSDTDPDLDAGDELAPHLSPLASAAQGAAPAAIGAGLAGEVTASRPAVVHIFNLSHYQR